MSVKVLVAPASEIEVNDITHFEDENTKKPVIGASPIFFGSGKGKTNVFLVNITSPEGQVIGRWSIQVNGSDLSLSVEDRTRPVPPAALKKKAKSK